MGGKWSFRIDSNTPASKEIPEIISLTILLTLIFKRLHIYPKIIYYDKGVAKLN